jgi:cytidyltransferase-like protein
MQKVVVSGSFDDIRSRQVRFLNEAAKLGEVHALIWSDVVARRLTGKAPRFPQAERQYLMQAIRYVAHASLVDEPVGVDALPQAVWTRANYPLSQATPGLSQGPGGGQPVVWAWDERDDSPARRTFCQQNGVDYRVLIGADLLGFPVPPAVETDATPGRKKVIVTGCFDWFHSGHVRFFEEASSLGDLYVVVGHDANVRLLKGEGHPLFPQDERRYMVQAARYVHQALVSSGSGWMDAEPEVERIKPDIYVVNEDGDKPEKREFCTVHGLEYVVLKRTPKEGLPRRESSNLRGF